MDNKDRLEELNGYTKSSLNSLATRLKRQVERELYESTAVSAECAMKPCPPAVGMALKRCARPLKVAAEDVFVLEEYLRVKS
jgi:hypothetical protein